MCINIIFIFYLSYLKNINSVIQFTFTKKLKLINETQIYEYLYNNEYITNISIGTPPQKIPITLNFDKHSFFIFDKEQSGEYNKKLSTTYNLINDKKVLLYLEYISEGFESNETIILNDDLGKEIKIEKASFILSTEKDKKYEKIPSAGIGLNFKTFSSIKHENFLNHLVERKIINSFAYFLNFNENNYEEGKIFIGSYPHEFDVENYDENNFNFISVSFSGNKNSIYEVPFDTYEFNKQKYFLNRIDFNASFGGILGNNNLKIELDKFFFSDLYSKNICFQVKNKDKIFIYCNENFNFKNFSGIKFHSKQFNYTFELNYNDLFKKEGNKFYFLMCFDPFLQQNFEVGEIFFRKYPFLFDQDRKIVGFYKVKKKEFNFFGLFIVIIIILIVICIFLLVYLIKYIYIKPRKIRANELSDNYDYIPQKDFQIN